MSKHREEQQTGRWHAGDMKANMREDKIAGKETDKVTGRQPEGTITPALTAQLTLTLTESTVSFFSSLDTPAPEGHFVSVQ